MNQLPDTVCNGATDATEDFRLIFSDHSALSELRRKMLESIKNSHPDWTENTFEFYRKRLDYLIDALAR